MKHYLLSLFVFLCIVVPACGDPESITDTTGSFLEDFSQAACERLDSCGFLQGPVQDCVDILVNDICSTEDCSQEITVDYSDWQDCLRSYETFSCGGVQAGDIPSECLTIDEMF